MTQRFIESSIMFKHMLDQNKSLCATGANGRPRIATLLELPANAQGARTGLITLQLADFHLKFSGIGMEAGMRCLNICLDEAVTQFAASFPGCRILFVQEASPGDYVILFEHELDTQDELFFLYLAYRASVSRSTSGRIQLLTGEGLELLVGFACLEDGADATPNTILFSAVCQAKRLAQKKIDTARFQSKAELKAMLAQGLTGMVYQPVTDLTSGLILGWEAFARSQSGLPIQDALRLFELTGSADKALEVERGLWRQALAGVGKLQPRQKLHINVGPACLADHLSHPAEFAKLAYEYGLELHQIVLEFSEKLSPGELASLPERLNAYRDLGFLTALDDVGAGQSNMMFLARFRPDYIKADISLTRDIECNPFKRVMVETLVLMAEKIGATVIAEGVETELALSSLVSMGVHAGQGFYLGPPSYPKPDSPVRIPPKASYGQAAAGEWKCSSPVGDLTTPCLIVETEKLISDVKELLADKPVMSSVVVVEGDSPLGLVMNYNLDKALSTKFGLDLYQRKRVTKLMDANPLCIEYGTPIEEAARLAMNRLAAKIYDDIIVTRDGALIGTVSVQKMLDSLAKVQVELAKGSNPLSGLPGNVAIEREFNRRAKGGIPSSLIYVDLDNFKVYNDVYGFNQGDKVILLTAQILRDVVTTAGAPQDFIGHVGGDDFVVISARPVSDALCAAIVATFADESPKLYSQEDRDRGYICGKNRDGVEQCFPLVTMSIGILDCNFQTPVTFEELSHRVAEVKKFAKSRPGNSVVRDRRAPLGATAPVSGPDTASRGS